ncbi:MAG: ATPase BadF/BadG/BcrA/BcrD type [Paenibacillus sp.]|jgi:N-acetylglucosamine kinase-like BadF-type ATPase|nr:ATPase BadF/BadG/BcrA/BcrD type [Paenibacillus sp.]
MLFLGVDGGGTKTAFLLMNDEGLILSRATLGSLDWFQIGAEGLRDTLDKGIGLVCREAGVDRSDLTYSMLGIPCLGDELIEEEPIVQEIIRQLLQSDRFDAVNDAEVGWAGSLACQAGIHLVSGTGSIGYGVDSSSRTARASGWGHTLGDEGSAYWLGRQLLAAFTREADRREERSRIYEFVRSYFNLRDDFQLLNTVQQEWEWNREKIAGLAVLLHQAADAGEIKAIKMFEQAACELSLIVRSIERQLQFGQEAEINVSYSGGVFRAGAFITEPLRKHLPEDRFTLIQPVLEPVAGAALYAFKRLYPDSDPVSLSHKLKQQTDPQLT